MLRHSGQCPYLRIPDAPGIIIRKTDWYPFTGFLYQCCSYGVKLIASGQWVLPRECYDIVIALRSDPAECLHRKCRPPAFGSLLNVCPQPVGASGDVPGDNDAPLSAFLRVLKKELARIEAARDVAARTD